MGIADSCTYLPQVLTGEAPFPGVDGRDVVVEVRNGTRPDKPENASFIGFSDSLWVFTERCWSGEVGSRPKVSRVVECLGREAAEWGRPMPPIKS